MGELGDRVRQARLDYGMTQAELARRSLVAKQTIYDIEHKRTRNPGVLHIVAIAQVLHVSVDSLTSSSPAEKS